MSLFTSLASFIRGYAWHLQACARAHLLNPFSLLFGSLFLSFFFFLEQHDLTQATPSVSSRKLLYRALFHEWATPTPFAYRSENIVGSHVTGRSPWIVKAWRCQNKTSQTARLYLAEFSFRESGPGSDTDCKYDVIMLRCANPDYYWPSYSQPQQGHDAQTTTSKQLATAANGANRSRSVAPKSRTSVSHGSQYNQGLSDPEQSHIYYEWMSLLPLYTISQDRSPGSLTTCSVSGRPHNVVCSTCRNPEGLFPCETCCRCYHTSCLPAPADKFIVNGVFHCPSCKVRQWDCEPPHLSASTPASSYEMSRSGAASSVKIGDLISSPSSSTVNSDGGSPEIRKPSLPVAYQTFSSKQPHFDNIDPRIASTSPAAGSSYYKANSMSPPDGEFANRARSLLVQYGGFHPNQEFSQELLHHLGWMIGKLESVESLPSEIQNLQEENAWLRRENSQLQSRSYYGPRLQPSESLLTRSSGTTSPIPRPSSDTTGRTWDSIVMDLI